MADSDPGAGSRRRLVEIDALRGLAALAVVLFHYTTRFVELYQPQPSPTLSFDGGQYGVNLFFIISGFVIFMTLERTRCVADFVVSRFSRLFPTYWFAILLTFLVTHLLGLPGKLVGADVAMANMVMLHGLFRVPHVDGVYWTLEVELLFYCGMLLLYRLNALGRIDAVLAGLLLLRLAYFAADRLFQVDLPFIAYRVLILGSIPWFALGISVYLHIECRNPPSLRDFAIPALAVTTLLLTESPFSAALAVVLGALVLAASLGRARWLQVRPLIWLGTISYPLYLLHENIGWSLQLRLLSVGMPTDWTVAVVLAVALALGHLVTRLVEQPSMRLVRSLYRHQSRRGPA